MGCWRWERRVEENGGWKGGDLLAERGMEGTGTTCLLKRMTEWESAGCSIPRTDEGRGQGVVGLSKVVFTFVSPHVFLIIMLIMFDRAGRGGWLGLAWVAGLQRG